MIKMERREFLVSVGRMLMAMILAAIAFLALRRGQGECDGSSLCRNCNLLASCDLPLATRLKSTDTVKEF
jgi:hypothetical protein